MDGVAIPQHITRLLNGFVSRLRAVYKDELVSVVLYGSAASGEFSGRFSNINLMIVLKDAGLTAIAKAHGIVTRAAFRRISPLFFTEEYIASSSDVFPIEFLDIMENHRIVFGKDVVKDIRVDTRNLRFQCEQELKSKLISIKKQYLAASDRNSLERLLFKSFTSSVHILRNVIRLKGAEPPYLKEEILSDIEGRLGVSTTVFSEILWAKNKNMRLSAQEADALLAGLVKELECVSRVVDTL